MPGTIQKKRRGDSRTCRPRWQRDLPRRRSPRNHRARKASSPPTITAKTPARRTKSSLDEATAREWLSRPRQRPAVHRGAGLLTPSASSASQPDVNLRDETMVFTLRGENTRDDDAESQGSMTTWPGDYDKENEDPSSRGRGDSSFDFDWSDEQADKTPIPWKDIQSYVDFHENHAAHEYWEWDREVLKWRHVDAETGEVVFCNTELD